MNPICYLHPHAKGCISLTGKPWSNQDANPTPVVQQYTSIVPGSVHCELENGECVMIPTGKGMILSKHSVEG